MRFATVFFCCLVLALATGCVAARNGVVGLALVRTSYPRIVMQANAPLLLQGYGREWVSLPTDFLGIQPSGAMDYAVYGEGTDGPVTRHAHVFVVRPNNDQAWWFQPESYPAPGGLSIGKQEMGGRGWTVQILRVDGQKDWFSAMWQTSGRAVPERWVARRFSATPERATRVVAEYREPWPECLDPDAKDLLLVSASCLEGFIARSNAAFSVGDDGAAPEDAAAAAPGAPSVLAGPPFSPDMKRLAGELNEEDRLWRRWRNL
jgi:hypothetical protein